MSVSSSASVCSFSSMSCLMRVSLSSMQSSPFSGLVEVKIPMACALPRGSEQGQRFKPLHESVVHDGDGVEEDDRLCPRRVRHSNVSCVFAYMVCRPVNKFKKRAPWGTAVRG